MKALVTGGGGFLGSAIARMLRERGDEVRSLSRRRYPELERLSIEQHCGDLSDSVAVDCALRGVDIVFHVGAKAGYWGPYRDYYRANVIGTRNVLASCRQYGTGKLVYTSTPSVVHTGRDLDGIDESAPVQRHFEAHYPATKAIAEREVLAANSSSLATVALRPHLIWGPGDNHLLPRLIDRVRAGKFRFIGGGKKFVDVIYIDNAALAHLQAADRLASNSPVAGKAYFLSQGQPVVMNEFVNQLLAAAGVPPVKKNISFRTAYAIGWLMELVCAASNIQTEPRLTRFVVKQFATAHWFDISAAKRDLGYQPIVSTKEGLRRLAMSLRKSP
jgi:nucleoside-diphosphate-sugar epimerase